MSPFDYAQGDMMYTFLQRFLHYSGKTYAFLCCITESANFVRKMTLNARLN